MSKINLLSIIIIDFAIKFKYIKKIYKEYFKQISEGTPTLDISDCPDLGPILFALAALKNGATFTGTDRLKAKESDRGQAMHQELCKFLLLLNE